MLSFVVAGPRSPFSSLDGDVAKLPHGLLALATVLWFLLFPAPLSLCLEGQPALSIRLGAACPCDQRLTSTRRRVLTAYPDSNLSSGGLRRGQK